MTGLFLIVAFSLIGALRTFLLFRRRTRFTRNLFVSFLGAIFSGMFVFALLRSTSGGLLGVSSRIFVAILFLIGLFEWFARLYFVLENKFAHETEFRFDDNKDLKTAAFYQSFEHVSTLAAARADRQLTAEFWAELQSFRHKMFVRTTQGSIKGNADMRGQYLNVTNGLRKTTDQPLEATSRVLMVGGSTTFCYESPDSSTVSSVLQRMLGGEKSSFRVENHGVGGATLMDRSNYLNAIDLSNVVLILVLFGDNEVGINLPRRWVLNYPAGAIRRPLYDFVVKLASVSALCRLLRARFGRLVFSDTEVDEDRISRVVDSCVTLDIFLRSKGIELQVFLQPNLYTRKNVSSDDLYMRKMYPSHWHRIVVRTYEHFRKHFENYDFFVDFSSILDDQSQFPYLDWAHVNSSGNAVIGESLYNHLRFSRRLREKLEIREQD